MSRRKRHNEFLSELEEINPSVEILGQYQSAIKKLPVRCSICGNLWETKPSTLLCGRGCPECGRKKIGDALRKTNNAFIQELATVNPNIEALEEYSGNKQRIALRCKRCNNEWKATPNDLLGGHGCPICGYEQQKKKRRDSHNAFQQKLQRINSDIDILDEYINNHTKVRFQCRKCGKIWSTVPNSVLSGHGCPNCARSSTSFLEQAILQAFILVLGDDAVLSRDRTLIGMELDIVIPALRVAYEPGSWVWHYNKRKRDTLKKEKCKQVGYRLVTIYSDYKNSTKPYETDCFTSTKVLGNSDWEDVKEIIESILSEFNLKIPHDKWDIIRKIALEKSKKKTTEEYKRAIHALNPKIAVLGEYADSSTKIAHKCLTCGMIWFAVPGSLLKGHGCPNCGKQITASLKRTPHDEFVALLATKNPDVTIVGQYKGSKIKIECKCRTCGYVWNALPNNLLRGEGCPLCGRKRAASKNSKMHEQFANELSVKNPMLRILGHYVNSSEKIEVECSKCGYSWMANPMDILNGHGCPKCAGSMKKTNEQFVQELSTLFPDIVPLEEYMSGDKKMRVKCRVCGYCWATRPRDLLRSKGCPNCRKKEKQF